MTTIQYRRGNAAEWAQANPILREGEPGYETNSRRHKIGDGESRWAELPYQGSSGGGGTSSSVEEDPSDPGTFIFNESEAAGLYEDPSDPGTFVLE